MTKPVESYKNWLSQIRSAKITSIISGNVRKFHYLFENGTEMSEEYSMETGIVLRRAWKVKKKLTNVDDRWEIELGDVVKHLNETDFLVKESNSEPILSKRVTKLSLEWRIRNLPYPIETYSVQADRDKRLLIVRTVNKKYYKEIRVPELERCEIDPEQKAVSFKHNLNTLIITYKKPTVLLEMERDVLLILKNVETEEDIDMGTENLLKNLMSY